MAISIVDIHPLRGLILTGNVSLLRIAAELLRINILATKQSFQNRPKYTKSDLSKGADYLFGNMPKMQPIL